MNWFPKADPIFLAHVAEATALSPEHLARSGSGVFMELKWTNKCEGAGGRLVGTAGPGCSGRERPRERQGPEQVGVPENTGPPASEAEISHLGPGARTIREKQTDTLGEANSSPCRQAGSLYVYKL